MKRLASLFAFLFIAAHLPAQVLITDFGSNEISNTDGSLTIVLGPTSSTISGSDAGSAYFFLSTPSIDLSGYTGDLSLTGTFNSGTSTASFEIQLFDDNDNFARFQGDWDNFTVGVPSTVTLTYIGSEGVVGNITIVGFVGSGGGLPTINFTADTLTTAVPEPSTYALLALGVGAVLIFRRRLRVA